MLRPTARVLVRGYDTSTSHVWNLRDDDHHGLDESNVSLIPEMPLRRGDTLIYIGQWHSYGRICVHPPARVLHVGPRDGKYQQVISLIDWRVFPRNDEAIPKDEIPGAVWATISELAMDGRPALDAERALLSEFYAHSI